MIGKGKDEIKLDDRISLIKKEEGEMVVERI